jgi:predicted kinase
VGLWLEAPERVLVDRLARRAPDASDADASVLRAQLAREPQPTGWERLEAGDAEEPVRARALAVLRRRMGDRVGVA